MRDPLRALTISGALALAAALAPALAQTGNAPAQDSGANATPAAAPDAPKDSSGVPPPPNVPDASKDSGGTAPPPNAPDAVKDSGGTAPPPNAPDVAKDPNAPRFATPNDAGESPSSDVAEGSAPSVDIPAADMKKSLSLLRRSTRDYMQCTSTRVCLTYFDSYGVGFTFADGTLAAFSHQQRGLISGHDCVVNARNALSRGDRSMAIQWMMAAQNDILNRNWISDHPDAMLKALRTFNGWG
jgi:hypothetical protein